MLASSTVLFLFLPPFAGPVFAFALVDSVFRLGRSGSAGHPPGAVPAGVCEHSSGISSAAVVAFLRRSNEPYQAIPGLCPLSKLQLEQPVTKLDEPWFRKRFLQLSAFFRGPADG